MRDCSFVRRFCSNTIAIAIALAASLPGVALAQFTTSFDPAPADWSLDAPVGGVGWAFDATPSTFPSGPSRSGLSLNYNNGVDYAGTNRGTVTSPAISLSGISNPVLRFWSNYNTETRGTATDRRFVEILDS